VPFLLPTVALALGLVTARAQPPLQVVSPVPRFLAPGGTLVVRGFAARAVPVRLLAGARTLASATTGRLGGFSLRARAPKPGRYQLSLETPSERRYVGMLVVRPLLLAAAGDVTFGAGVATAIATHGPRYPWLSVAPLLRSADLATANLEGTVSTRGAPAPNKAFTFRGPPSALSAAAEFAGIDVFTVANNHSLDYGVELERYPDGRQQQLAAAALNAGAAVVLGSHPHVLQPIAAPRRGRLVAWSLGNFVFPAHSPGTEQTGVLLVRLDRRGVRGYSFRPAEIAGVQPRLRSSP
jgi:hypothetical protein